MRDEILVFAKSQIGQKEIKGNMGFVDPVFDMIMRRVGFEDSQAWCALFAEACYSFPTYEHKSKVFLTISDCFSANAVRTYDNFQKYGGEFFEVGKKLLTGSVVIWEKRTNGEPIKNDIWTVGHAGIVSEVHEDYFKSIEGNGNSSGGREGIEVVEMVRKYNYFDKDGLCLKGFITPLL